MENTITNIYIDLKKRFAVNQSFDTHDKFVIHFASQLIEKQQEDLILVGSLWLKSLFQSFKFDENMHSLFFTELAKQLQTSAPNLAPIFANAALVTETDVEKHIDESDSVINNIVNWHIKLFSKIDPSASDNYFKQMINDGQKHLDFIIEAKTNDSPELFIEYCNWVNSVLVSLNIPTLSLIRFLISIKLIYNIQNKQKRNEYNELIHVGIERLLINSSSTALAQKNNKGLHKEYLSFLFKGDRSGASKFIHQLVKDGVDIKSIYLDVFQESQYEIGRLWEKNEISVAQEHYCTATTQMIMSQLYPQIFSGKNNGKNIIATCVGSELHEIGVRMVADFLEMEGWNTYYLGANTPSDAILEAIIQYEADILAISVTMVPHVKKAKELISEIKLKSQRPVKIIVGGYPFLTDENLWKKIGADAYSKTAKEVNEIALTLVNLK